MKGGKQDHLIIFSKEDEDKITAQTIQYIPPSPGSYEWLLQLYQL